ncbi:mitochondrial carrier domain-containing protein [Protomyces lactucae-debilis]|uniref:Mitochondrial carrier domain-containing protein n=1 Tax=Protomyces lactucae-debilis TaxID=2754530 RepID=A0A1Y2FNR8_PROLT|nr:mitochondrial carrier domain-containing protein [Protomyces lactucae-debilis]ORY85618.1 mitochondrial carrier domain-containing protein [Protomyces lactucae-debilis]
MPPSKETPEEAAKRRKDEQIRRLFTTLDVRRCGELRDIDDLRAGLRELQHPLEGADNLLQEVFDHIDSGNDGIITFSEFRVFVLETEDKLRRLFEQLDVLHQGRLKRFEIQRALHKAGVHTTDGRMNELFEAMDKNNDGYITFDEWRDYLLFLPEQLPDIKNVILYFQSIHQVSSEGDILISDEALQSIGYFLAGGLAGAVSRTATAPFDRLKVALIASTENTSKRIAGAALSRSLFRVDTAPLVRALSDIYANGGLRSFFIGNGLNVLKIFPESAIKFGSYEAAKKFIAGPAGTDELSSASRFLAGGIAGAVSQASVYPIDTLKFRVQCESGGNAELGSVIRKTASKMWAQGGLRSFYRGLPLGIVGIIPYSSIDLGTFELLKRSYIKRKAKRLKVSERDVDVPNHLVLGFGASSGAFGASLVYPLNLLRTRLQAQGTRAHPATYTGLQDVIQSTLRKQGWRGLFRGLLPNLMKVIPSVSISYLVYEKSKQQMGLR